MTIPKKRLISGIGRLHGLLGNLDANLTGEELREKKVMDRDGIEYVQLDMTDR
jgi:hypothetical protein